METRILDSNPMLEYDPSMATIALRVGHVDFDGLLMVLPVGTFVIGRDPLCDHWLDHATVSRRHCSLDVAAVSIRITDLQSTHGTLVNGRSVQAADLRISDLVRLGDITLRVEILPKRSVEFESNWRYPKEHRPPTRNRIKPDGGGMKTVGKP